MSILLKTLISLIFVLFICSYNALIQTRIKTISTLTKSLLKNKLHVTSILKSSILDDIEDEEELESFQRIASNYLRSKFFDCYGNDCKNIRDRNDVSILLRNVLPPLSKVELEDVVNVVLSRLNTSEISSDDFLKEGKYNIF